MLRAAVRLTALTLAVQAALCAADGRAHAGGQASGIAAAPTRTAKERLGGKATDEQRVDNCKVPPALRGPKPRPDKCDGASAGAQR